MVRPLGIFEWPFPFEGPLKDLDMRALELLQLRHWPWCRWLTVARNGAALCVALAGATSAAVADDLKVVVTIKPVHALVAEVMAGIGVPVLVVDGTASPHTYALRPSDVRALSGADVVVRVSAAMEPFTAKVITSLPARTAVVTLDDTPGLISLARRVDAAFEDGEHDLDHGSGHSHEATVGVAADAPGTAARDPHIWLDPENAKMIIDRITVVLREKLPQRADLLAANAAAARARIDALSADIGRDMAPLRDRPFLVFHDATQYFERRFGLKAVGAITVNADATPGARRLSALRGRIKTASVRCVFREPNVAPRAVAAVIEGTGARMGELDPEGTSLPAGRDHYDALMRKLAAGFKGCLADQITP